MKRIGLLVLCLLCGLTVGAQRGDCRFTHYSSEDGLSQNTIMYMLQDREGFIWLATWDGFDKFDGYSFTTYKARPNNAYSLKNNRIDWIGQDVNGYIWLKSYDNKAHRFDPKTETFEQVPAEGQFSDLVVEKVCLLNNGVSWLIGEGGGAVRVIPKEHGTYNLDFLGYGTSVLPGRKINQIFADSKGSEWLLTDKGIAMFQKERTPVVYFSDLKKTVDNSPAFYKGCETGGFLYLASDAGRLWRYDMKSGRFIMIEMPTREPLIDVCPLGKEKLIVLTQKSGFYIYDRKTGSTQSYTSVTCPEIAGKNLVSVFVDSHDIAWFELLEPRLACYFNSRTGRVKLQHMNGENGNASRSNPAFHIHEDCNHVVWVHPYGGGFSWYDSEQDCLVPFYDDLGSSDWHFSNKIHSAMSDRQGNLWLCTHSKGLEKITFPKQRFTSHLVNPNSYESLSNEVRSLFQDADGLFWVGKKNAVLSVYNKDGEYLGYLTEKGTISKTGQSLEGVVYCMMQDSKGVLWIGTKGNGVIKAVKGTHGYQLSRYEYHEDDIYSLSNNSIYSIYEDHKGRLWLTTFGGGLDLMEQQPDGKCRFISHRNNLKNYPIARGYRSRCIVEDKQHRLWVGTTSGVLSFNADFKTPEDIQFTLHSRVPGDQYSLSNNDVHGLYCTSGNGLYLSTFGGGLNKLLSYEDGRDARFKSYTTSSDFPFDIILALEEDKKGNLWISSESALCKFNPRTEHVESYNGYQLGLNGIRFNEATSTRTADGQLVFGTSNGFLSFQPDSICKSSFVPRIVFSRLLIAGKVVRAGENGPLGNLNINECQKLVLKPKENTFTVYFSALDMNNPTNISYAYKLEGFDKDWQNADQRRSAVYTNLPKGNYILHVKSTNSDGEWVNNDRMLEIVVKPTFWETPWAYVLFVLIAAALFAVAVFILFTIFRLKHEVSVEQKVSDIKLRFFTNISHELRTPLTLIAGPLEHVLSNGKLTKDDREQLQIVERNTDRMLRLVNQILDFRKIQNKKMKLRVEQIELVSFVHRVMENFEALAFEHKIDYIFESEQDRIDIWADADKLEKIIFNLLSNAFKYTPQGKMIKVFIQDNEDRVAVGVLDQGIGIPENRRASLFVRFESLLDRNLFDQQSTGIGLSLVKELVELHKASISVESKPGEGSCFTVNLQKGKEYFGNDVDFLVKDDDVMVEHHSMLNESVDESVADHEDSTNGLEKVMLIVEDNVELRIFLRSLFSADFKILEAGNGLEGGSMALKYIPDIIISDVMMPEKDGMEMMKDLRTNVATSHIPIVLLTAKTTIDSQLEGLEKGADDYITKPFSAAYLKARIDNLLRKQDQLREAYSASLMDINKSDEAKNDVETVNTVEMTTADKRFMDSLTELMEKNMDNGDLVVDDLVKELAVSRSVFFKKLKTLTGMAPIEFIKEMRIKRSAKLLESGEFNMTQISYMVGFNDPRYFSKCFKQKFGMTPTEYKDYLKKKGKA